MEKNMKHILMLILGLSSVGTFYAMEKPQQEIINIEYKGPQFNPYGNLYQICALSNNHMIGYITYAFNKITNRWEMGTLSVQKPFRRVTIATKLLKQCIEHLARSGYNQLDYNILSLDPSLCHEELMEIYQKIAQSLNAQIIPGKTYSNSLIKMTEVTVAWNNLK